MKHGKKLIFCGTIWKWIFLIKEMKQNGKWNYLKILKSRSNLIWNTKHFLHDFDRFFFANEVQSRLRNNYFLCGSHLFSVHVLKCWFDDVEKCTVAILWPTQSKNDLTKTFFYLLLRSLSFCSQIFFFARKRFFICMLFDVCLGIFYHFRLLQNISFSIFLKISHDKIFWSNFFFLLLDNAKELKRETRLYFFFWNVIWVYKIFSRYT